MKAVRAQTTRPAPISVGRQTSRAERQADLRARSAERRLGFPARTAPKPHRLESEREHHPAEAGHDVAAPGAVERVMRTPGTPLAAPERERMERAFDHDFSRVRIHADPPARTAAASIGARAFTLGSHVALPGGEPGALTHELAHVVANERSEDRPDVVRRLSVGEWFARLVGEGTYSEGELKTYLLKLEQSNQIEDTGESDDKARQVVKQGLHKSLSPDAMKSLQMRRLLIEEMISGFTGDDDEQAILRILEDAPVAEREWLVKQIGMTRLEDEFHGEEFEKLQTLLGRLYDTKDAPVPLDWHVEYQLKGPEHVLKSRQGLLLRNLAFRPEGATQKTDVANNEDLVLSPGETRVVSEKPLEHPRNKAGQGFAELQVGPVDKEGLIVPETETRRPAGPANYPAVDPLKKSVLASFDIELKAEEIGHGEERTGPRETRATGTRTSKQVAKGTETSTEQSRDVEREVSRTDSATLDYERRLAKKKEREKSKSESRTESEEKGKETQKRKEETKSESETKGSETFGQTEEIEGGGEFSGKFDAELKGEIEKASGVNWATVAKWALKLGKLAPGVYGRVLRRLGPVGEKILELFEPNEDDLEIEFDAEGNFSLKGTFKAKKSVEGWRKFRSKTKGSSTTTGKTESESQKKGTARTEGTGEAERTGEEESKALKEGRGASVGQREAVKKGTKTGRKESKVETVTTERFEETRTEEYKETAETRKKFVAIVDKATLTFKMM